MKELTPRERVLISLSYKEPDRVPLFLALSFYGAKELGMTIKEYFSKPKNVIYGQMKMREKYKNDFYYGFYYASLEIEAFGGESIFIEDGPPNAGDPVIKKLEDIDKIEIPDVKNSIVLKKVFETQHELRKNDKIDIPIIGVIVSPFALPIMQMGFDKYIELIYNYPDYFWKLMKKNMGFSISWANMQLKAGADVIVYFDPLLSTEMIPLNILQKTGFLIAKESIDNINGPVVIHMASAKVEDTVEEFFNSKIVGIGISKNDDLKRLKKICKGKMALIGNLDGISMRKWNKNDVERNIKKIIYDAASGGGLIISDNHGEIPWQIDEEILMNISENVRKYGKYPIQKGE